MTSKIEHIQIRLTREGKAQIVADAKKAGLSVTEYILSYVLHGLLRHAEPTESMKQEEVSPEETQGMCVVAGEPIEADLKPIDPSKPVIVREPGYRFSPGCHGNRCKRIGAPCCNPCRKLNKMS